VSQIVSQGDVSPSHKLLTWLPLILLGLTLVALFFRLLTGEVLFWGLPSLQFYPWREFAMSELSQGRLPLWNPYNGAGVPLLANYQSALLYPPNLLYFLWPGPQTMGILGLLHLAWAGLGMWLLTNRLGATPLGRGVATLAYPLSTTLVARFGTPPMIDVAAWLPWLILATDRLIDEVRLSRLLALAGVVAMQMLAGHAQWTFYCFVLAGGYGLWRLAAERHRERHRRPVPVLAAALIGVALGLGIAAAQLLPTAELQRESRRATGVEETFALNFSYAPLSLITLFNPNFFGNPGDGSYVIGGAYFETAAYVGILPVTLALLGIGHHFLRALRRWRKMAGEADAIGTTPRGYLIPFFALVTVIAVVLAFGKFTPIYPLFYHYVPVFNLFQAPARWLLLAVFSLALLAAFAASLWKPDRRAVSRARIGLIGAASLFAAGIVVQLLLRDAPPITIQMAKGLTILGFLGLAVALIFTTQPGDDRHWTRWAASVLVFVAVDLWWANASSNPTVPASFYEKQPAATSARIFWPDEQNQALPEVAFTRFLPFNDYRVAVERQADYRQSNLPNLNLLDRQPSLNDFDPLRPDGLERFTGLLNASLRPGLLQAAAVGKVYGSNQAESNPPRAWMVPAAISVDSAESAERIVAAADWNPYQTVVVEGSVSPVSSQQPGTARIVGGTPLELNLAVDSPDGGMLVVADTYFPDWEASIDGAPTTIYRANLAFRAVVVPAGAHSVRMIYQPQTLAVGAAISGVSLAVYGLLLVILLMRRGQQKGILSASGPIP
jgi:hypothetical protein